MTIYKTNLNYNKAKTGGAIWNVGKTTVNNSTLNKNKATKSGGAVYNEESRFTKGMGTMSIKNSKLIGNSPSGKKTVFIQSGKVTIDKSTTIK